MTVTCKPNNGLSHKDTNGGHYGIMDVWAYNSGLLSRLRLLRENAYVEIVLNCYHCYCDCKRFDVALVAGTVLVVCGTSHYWNTIF